MEVGKSSFIDSIIFGLFGETTKDLTKAQIINWKNKKECEIKITFNKLDVNYIIHRGLKPNFIKVYKNGTELDQLSSLPEMQSFIESNILEMDYDTFISLIHYNPTTSKSIFNVQKAQKRSFIEKIFGLEIYSQISDKCNKKLSLINSKINESSRIIEVHQSHLNKINEEYESNFKAIKIEKEQRQQKIQELINSKNNISLNDISEYENKKELLQTKINEFKQQISNINNELSFFKNEKNNLNIEKISFNNKLFYKLSRKIHWIKKLNLDTSDIELLIKEKTSDISKLNEQHKSYELKKQDLSNKLNNLKKLESGICPMCGHDIDAENLSLEISKIEKEIKDIDCEIGIVLASIAECNSKIEMTENFISKKRKMFNRLNSYNNKYIEMTEDKLKYDKWLENKDKFDVLSENIINKTNELSKLESDLIKYEKMLTRVDIEIDKDRESRDKLEKIEEEIKLETYMYENMYNDNQMKTLHESHEALQRLQLKKIDEEQKALDKYKDLLDYFEFIKKICKDEHVKQYAISNIVPYLNKQVNKYLADASFDFYLKLDGWLNAEVKGVGIRDAGFGNLSSGQQKTTNLAMILSFLDICKMQSSIFPDILLLDEILDGAIDSSTLTQMFNIIAKKQKEDKLKLFIVTHRKEISELSNIDNIYQIEMKDGFSTVTKKER